MRSVGRISLRHITTLTRDDSERLPWQPVALAALASGVHAGLAAGLGHIDAHAEWAAAAAVVALPPAWALLALVRRDAAHTPQGRMGAVAWGVAVLGLQPLFREAYLINAAWPEPLLFWCLLWTALLYLYRHNQAYFAMTGLSARQWWKLGGGALAVAGTAFWLRPMHGLPLYGPGLYCFAAAAALMATGFSLSLCAYLERLGIGLTNWTLRRALGTLLQGAGFAAVLASAAFTVQDGAAHLAREAEAAGIALLAGLACLAYAATLEWRYHLRMTRQPS